MICVGCLGFASHNIVSFTACQLKLTSPMGVAETLCNDYDKAIASRRALVDHDVAALKAIDGVLAANAAQMEREFEAQLSRIDNVSRLFDLLVCLLVWLFVFVSLI